MGGFPKGTKAARLLRGEALHPASPNPWMPSEGGQLLPKGFLVTQTWGSDVHTRNWGTRQLPGVWLVPSTTLAPSMPLPAEPGGVGGGGFLDMEEE